MGCSERSGGSATDRWRNKPSTRGTEVCGDRCKEAIPSAKAREGESLLIVSVFPVIYKAKLATDQRRGQCFRFQKGEEVWENERESGLPSKAESSTEVSGHEFKVNLIRMIVCMFFSRTFSSLGASGQRAEGSCTKVKIFQRV